MTALGAAPAEGPLDWLDARAVLRATPLLGAFNRAGVLLAADVHVGLRLVRLAAEQDERVALAAAVAVRAVRLGHVRVDLATVRATAVAEVAGDAGLTSLPWPDPRDWVQLMAASPLVAAGEGAPFDRPLRLVGTSVYLDRYWRDEGAVATDLLARTDGEGPRVDETVLGEGLRRLFPDDSLGEQRWAAAAAVLRRLSVIAGGPGTGKTTAMTRLLALLEEQAVACGDRPPLLALVAPTGRAAARMEEAVHTAASRMAIDESVRERLLSIGACTIHRLLGRHPASSSRFRHHRHNHLPHDVVVVDETSMVPLSLMARLTEAVRPNARLVLIGDPHQLASVEAGAVLGDIVAPAMDEARMSAEAAAALRRVSGVALPCSAPPAGVKVGDAMVVLRANHRFSGALADLATSVDGGDGDATVEVLRAGDPTVRWLDVDVSADSSSADPRALDPIREAVVASGSALIEAAVAGLPGEALDELGRFRVLCVHRLGPAGVQEWTERIESWLAAEVDGFAGEGAWHVGRPVMVTANDYGLRLFNGDTGVAVAGEDGGVSVVFRRGASLVHFGPSRLSSAETVFATTVHKAQGSELDQVAIVLPPSSSPLLTRQLLYTAVTRARKGLILVGSEESVRAAVERPIARASGLTQRLWDSP